MQQQQPAANTLCDVLTQGGGLRVNNKKVGEEGATVGQGDLVDGRLLLLAAGKKNKLVLRVTD